MTKFDELYYLLYYILIYMMKYFDWKAVSYADWIVGMIFALKTEQFWQENQNFELKNQNLD